MKPVGNRDFNSELRPVSEKICFNLAAGLSREGLKASDAGANKIPPCANDTTAAVNHAAPMGAADQRNANQIVRGSSSVSGLKSAVGASASACRVYCDQLAGTFSICQANTKSAASVASALLSSRLRGTCPCSRALSLLRGVGFSVFSPAIGIVLYRYRPSRVSSPGGSNAWYIQLQAALSSQPQYSLAELDAARELVFKQSRPVRQRPDQGQHAEHALDRHAHDHDRQLRRRLAQKG